MTNYYVYVPTGIEIISLNCYCFRRGGDCSNCTGSFCKDIQDCLDCVYPPCQCSSCCKHIVVGESSGFKYPVDIRASSGSVVWFWGSPNIFSIKIEYSGGICSNVPCGQYGFNDIGCGIKVHAYTGYNASGIRLGIVHYCHLTGRIPPNGAIYNRSGDTKWGVALGYVPAVPPSQNCYLSEHIHTCIYGDGGQAYRAYFKCGSSVSGGSTVLYWWAR